MSGIRQENRTFGQIFKQAVELALSRGEISEKTLRKKLDIALPTAIKVLAAMYLCGFIATAGKRGYAFYANAERLAALDIDNGYVSSYLMLVEEDKAYKNISFVDYARDTLLQALNFSINFGGSMSPGFLKRKLNVGIERATEIFDVIYACGLLGSEDEFNPGRRKLTVTHAGYDEMYNRINGAK